MRVRSYTHDYIEIFNRGNVSVPLNGMSVQYASATGTGNFGASTTQITELPSVALLPGQYFLIQEASNAAVGAPLPTADVVDGTPINMSGTAGKVALVVDAVTLGCNGSSTQPCSPAQLARIVDLVGYGNANFFEGAGAAPDADEHVVGGSQRCGLHRHRQQRRRLLPAHASRPAEHREPASLTCGGPRRRPTRAPPARPRPARCFRARRRP